jgi:predicted transcriptional regulator
MYNIVNLENPYIFEGCVDMKMKDLKASDVMVRPVVSAKKNASARDVTLQLLINLYSGMPVTDEEKKVIGVITELDLLEAVINGKELATTTIEGIMTKEPVTVDVDTPIIDVVQIMKEKDIIRLPITDKGVLVGTVARSDILKGLIKPEFFTHYPFRDCTSKSYQEKK